MLVYPLDESTMPALLLDAGTLQQVDQYPLPPLPEGDVLMGREYFYVSPYISGSGIIEPHTAITVYDIKNGAVITTVVNPEPASEHHLALHEDLLYLGVGSYYGNADHVVQYDLSSGLSVLSDTVPSGFVNPTAPISMPATTLVMAMIPITSRFLTCGRWNM